VAKRKKEINILSTFLAFGTLKFNIPVFFSFGTLKFNIPVFFSFNTLYQNRTAKHRYIKLKRAEHKEFRKCVYLINRIIHFRHKYWSSRGVFVWFFNLKEITNAILWLTALNTNRVEKTNVLLRQVYLILNFFENKEDSRNRPLLTFRTKEKPSLYVYYIKINPLGSLPK